MKNIFDIAVKATIVLVLFATAQNTKLFAKAKADKNNANIYEATTEKGKSFLKKIDAVYTPYEKVAASFVLKGKLNDSEIYFTGNLLVKKAARGHADYLSITLKDSVFESKVYQLIIHKGMVTNIDYLDDKKETIPLSRFTWAEVLGSVFPFKFFYPLLSGFPPAEIYNGTIHETSQKIINDKGKYDVAVTLQDFVMDNIYLKTQNTSDVIVFRVTGKRDRKRYFPRKIYMERSKNRDHLEILFTYVNIR